MKRPPSPSRALVCLAGLLIGGCSARLQSPDAAGAIEPSAPDAAPDAAPPPDAGPPDAAPPLVVPAAARPAALPAAAFAEWRAELAETLDFADGYASVVVLGDAVLDRTAVGHTETGEAMTPGVPRPMGPATRALTGLLVAALIEEGHLSWSAPATRLRPDWAADGIAPSVADLTCACFGTDAVPGTPPTSPTKVLESLRARLAAGDALEAMPTPLLTAAAGYLTARGAPGAPLEPGEAFASQIAARVTGPLRMTGTTIGSPAAPGVVPVFAPDHGAWATPDDLARLVVAMMGEGATPTGGRVVERGAIAALLEAIDGPRGPATRGGWRVERRGAVELRVVGGRAGKGWTRIAMAPATGLAWAVRVEEPVTDADALARTLDRAFDRLLALRYGLGDAPPPPRPEPPRVSPPGVGEPVMRKPPESSSEAR